MALLDELKKALGLEDEEPLMVPMPPDRFAPPAPPPQPPGSTPERDARLREMGLDGGDDEGGLLQMLGDNLDRDRRQLGDMLTPAEQPKIDPLPTTAYIDQGTHKQMWAPTRKTALQALEQSKRGAGTPGPPREPAVASAATRAAPDETGADDSGKADLLYAMSKAAKPPEEQGEEPNDTPGQQIHPEPTSSTGADRPSVATGLRSTSGGPLGSVTQLVMGSSDPRVERLKAALAKSKHMKELAGHVTGMGIGADLVQGTHLHGDQGKGLRDRADDEVREAVLPTEFEQKNARFDIEQARAGQDMRLRDSADARAQQGELRAESGERRAGADELRKQKGFDTAQGASDPSSQTSASARASIEALYPAAWKRIPEETRNGFSAKDVERIFGEIKPGFGQPAGPSKSSGIDNRQARAMAAKAKLNDPSMVHAMNDILATLDTGTAPGTGYFMNEGGWQNFIRSPDGQQFRQAMLTVMNPYIHEVHGANVTDNELERAMTQFGYGNFDDPQTLASGMRRVAEGLEAKQNQRLHQLPPDAQKLLDEQGAIEHVDSKRGRALKGNPEQKFEDSFDVPTALKPYIGVLGMAKKWLGGGPKKGPGGRNLTVDAD